MYVCRCAAKFALSRALSVSLCGVIALRMRAFLLTALPRLSCAAARRYVNSTFLTAILLLLRAVLRLSCAAARCNVNAALLTVISL